MQVALICNSVFGTDGISMFVINNHRYLKKDGMTYYLIYSSIHSPQEVIDGYVSTFCKDGDKAKFITKRNGLLTFARKLYEYLVHEKIDIVHVNGSSSAILLEIVVAKMAGARKIISHAHSTGSNHPVVHKLLRSFVNILVDERLACSEMAGQWMYGRRKSFTIIPNCINTADFTFDINVRNVVRKELGIGDDVMVIGHVGTFTEVKNQSFLLHILKLLSSKYISNYLLLLIGHGPLKDNIMKECEELGLNDSVLFLGNRNDVPRLLMAMDVFCMPSLYEGFPITSVEAQATGLPLILSSNITSDVCITDLVRLLPIDQGVEIWSEEIKQIATMHIKREYYAVRIKDAGYDIRYSAELLERMYTM